MGRGGEGFETLTTDVLTLVLLVIYLRKDKPIGRRM